ncbi:hypothetical protein FUAX_46420 (plasmid) [Fulvitalea axinellae]|uniref:DNA alkylation repair protein n=1 Tax=Fulvitalea axinellae TaxID=1182444 RepID=A0AAU9DI13_9BACT|nr:hypothetical protein FUAX_46420 [Fulvitalea axinellae]
MKEYTQSIEKAMGARANPERAEGQKSYMKNRFEFFGLASTERREIQKPFLQKTALPSKGDAYAYIKELWQKDQRELQYFAQELAFRYRSQISLDDIKLYEYMITEKSWWDSVDFIASNLVGNYFRKYPDERERLVQRWLDSGNIWLQRSALLFQLKYKSDLDTELLTATIEILLAGNEFFINKAIGWILREYGKTNPQWVLDFADKHKLSPLSRREALRIIL